MISQNKKQKKVESLYAKCVSSFGCQETGGITWFKFFFFSFFFFNFGLCIEFLIELLKKIEALLFFEIELVCGIRLYFWVLFDFWKDWISDQIFVYMFVYVISQNKKQKKRWVALCKVCFTIWLSRNRGNHLVSIFYFLYFFIFWFLYWISYRIVKIDRNFIVFWDWIGMWNHIIFLGFVWFLKRLNLKSNLCVFACFLGAFGLV